MSGFLMTGLYMGMLAVEFFVFVILSSSFFQFRKTAAKTAVICVIAYFANYVFLTHMGQNVVIKLLQAGVVFILLSKCLYSISIVHCIFSAIIFLSFVNIGDNILAFFLSAAGHMSIAEVIAEPFSYYLQAYFAKTVELVIAALIHAWGKRRFYTRGSFALSYLKLTIFPAMSLVCAVTLMNTFLVYPQATPQLFLCTMILLVSDIVIILLLDQFEAQQQAMVDNQLLQRELRLAHDNIQSLSVSYSNERKLTHDFQNELAVIQGLLRQEQAGAKTADYIDQLMNQEYVPILAVSTHRAVADVLLNQKYIVAGQKQIRFQVQLDDLSGFPLPDDALVVVLSNLIDNALDACEKVEDPDNRSILVKARVSNEESMLYIENAVAAPVKISNGYIATTKKNRLQHGYGLQNVLSIIKAYDGVYAMRCENLKFSFVLSFSNRE